ncbi:endonuclease/exonuclease/phosphatase family protein [Candidatus Saccharibacteria bacterium]|nr:endonuclease/exonuclease/phosphatase family protein [Candidatus Saccharibacteria bacterium]
MYEVDSKRNLRTWCDKLRIGVAGAMLLGLPPVIDETHPASEYAEQPLQQQDEVRLITANVHNQPLSKFYLSSFQMANPQAILDSRKPDVTCFQEISNTAVAKLSKKERAYVRGSKTPLNNVGVALLSSRKMKNVDRVNLSKNSLRPAIVAEIDDMLFACLHLTDDGLSANQELQALLKKYPGLDVAMGDFNLTPDKIDRTMGRFAIASTLEPTLTRGVRPAVDRIFLSRDALALKYSDSIVFETGSDHRAVEFIGIPSNIGNFDPKELHQ